MLVGHYGASFAAKSVDPGIPLWVLFVATQLPDVIWAPLVLLGVEKLRIVPGFTASTPLDLYYMPYTHSLVAAVAWAVAVLIAYASAMRRPRRWIPGSIVAAAVFSHWPLDYIVHEPDLPLYDNTAKVGLGLWNYPVLAFGVESTLLLAGMAVYFRRDAVRRTLMVSFAIALLVGQLLVIMVPPVSDTAAATTAIGSYVVLAAVVRVIEQRSRPAALPHR